jgi:hypothetical protein
MAHTHIQAVEYEDVTVLWKRGAQTGREVMANRPDMVIKNKTEKHA